MQIGRFKSGAAQAYRLFHSALRVSWQRVAEESREREHGLIHNAIQENQAPHSRRINEPCISRGPMRATIRPFKIEFKKRFSRSSPKHSSTAEDVGESPTTASFSNVGVFTAGRRRDADGFSDARKAADALFARSDSAAPRWRRFQRQTRPPAECCRASSNAAMF